MMHFPPTSPPPPAPSFLKRAKGLVRRIADRPHTRPEAEATIAKILKDPNVRRPGPDVVRRARDYADGELGDWQLYPELLIYATYRGSFVEGWIPNTFFGRVLPLVNHEYYAISRARALGRRILDTDLLPDIAYYAAGAWYDLEGKPIARRNLRDHLFAGAERVFIKGEGSRGGEGVLVATPHDFDETLVSPFGSAVVQRAITQCPLFRRIQPDSVCTLRVMTTRAPGCAPRAVASLLRAGRGRSAVVTSDEISIPVLDREGRLDALGADEDWVRVPAHPDTGFRFAGAVIEGHEAVLEACEALHARVPQFAVIGWDATINAEGRCEIMEWDTRHPGIRFIEAAMGPIFADLALADVMRRHLGGAPAAASARKPGRSAPNGLVGLPAE